MHSAPNFFTKQDVKDVDTSPFNSLLPTLMKKYGESAQAVFAEIAKTGFSDYQSLEELDFDIGIRTIAIQLMNEMNDSKKEAHFGYASATSKFSTPSQLWETRPLKLVQQEGACATNAMEDLFKHGANLDCERSIHACWLGAIARVCAINNMSPQFDALQKLELKHQNTFETLSFLKIPLKKVMVSNILPGDRMYFTNLANYRALNRGGFASGEHSIYSGNKVFNALGLDKPYTTLEMCCYLTRSYSKKFLAFENYIYERISSPKWKRWPEIFPGSPPENILEFTLLCKEYFTKFLKENKNKTFASEELFVNAAKESLMLSFAEKIWKFNLDNGLAAYRIDTPRLLAMLKALQKEKEHSESATATPMEVDSGSTLQSSTGHSSFTHGS